KFSSEEHLKVTVSIGLSTFPEDAQIKEALITETDKAMYCAKFSGKNQTCVA
ncbi:MAG: diguanylate cyclase, partial [Candidatus Omnitrophica bacterium]|nr:diguanylate cyclase [Candidatus Omnitrophota bacterium]